MRLLCFYPFDSSASGLVSRILPLRGGFRENNAELDIVLTGAGNEPVLLRAEGGPCDATSNRKQLPLSPELMTVVSELAYFGIGRFVPPIFRAQDIVVALKAMKSTFEGYDAVVCQKPWFRTAIPALHVARQLSVPALLDIDDMDLTPRAPFIDRFTAVSVATETLALRFVKHDPLRVPNSPTSEMLAQPSVRQRATGQVRILWAYPATGIPKAILGPMIAAVLAGRGNAKITMIGFPYSIAQVSANISPNGVFASSRVSHDKFVQLLDQHDISLILDGDTLYEQAKGSIRLMEAMARRHAVIAWDVGETGSVLRTSAGGVLVPYRDFSSLSRAISTLTQDTEMIAVLGSNNRRYIERLPTWTSSAAAILFRLGLPAV